MAKQARMLVESEVRRRIFALIEAERPGWEVTRVDARYIPALEAYLMAKLRSDIHHSASRGKTFGTAFLPRRVKETTP